MSNILYYMMPMHVYTSLSSGNQTMCYHGGHTYEQLLTERQFSEFLTTEPFVYLDFPTSLAGPLILLH
jgi:hypothetical protein